MFISPGLFAAIAFFSFLVVVALCITILLMRDSQEKQTIFSSFANHLNEFLVVLNKDGILLDVSPRTMSDPLFERILQKKTLEGVLSSAELSRYKDYIKGLESYPDIPFIFSYAGESGSQWYELRATIRRNHSERLMVLLIKNVTMDVDSRSQRDRLQENMDMLLQNTGDFLWSMDVDSRQFVLLTPITDDEGRVVPRSLGVQDLRQLMPEEDFALFEKRINARIVAFRASNRNVDVQSNLKLRLIGMNGEHVWYNFRCRIYPEENSKIVVNGSARRMDLMLESQIIDGNENLNAMFSSALAFPDVRVFCVDREYKVVGCNSSFALNFGHPSPKNLLNQRLLEVVRPKYYTFMQSVLAEVFERGKAKSWRGFFERDNRLLWFNAVPLKNLDGYTYRVVGVYIPLNKEDFTDVKKESK